LRKEGKGRCIAGNPCESGDLSETFEAIGSRRSQLLGEKSKSQNVKLDSRRFTTLAKEIRKKSKKKKNSSSQNRSRQVVVRDSSKKKGGTGGQKSTKRTSKDLFHRREK